MLLARYLWQSRSVGVAVVDAEGRVLAANERLARIAGADVVGRRADELVSPAQRAALAALMHSASAEWSSLRLGLAPDGNGVPQDYLVSTASAGAALLVVAEPLVADVYAVNARLLDLTE